VPPTRVDHGKRHVPSEEYRHGAGAAGRTGRATHVGRNVNRDDGGVPPVPPVGLDPRQHVEQGRGAAVASVHDRRPLDVGVAGEQVHQHRLCALGLIDKRLGADLEKYDVARVDHGKRHVPSEEYRHGAGAAGRTGRAAHVGRNVDRDDVLQK
jgi:hypothetical protein